MPPSHLPTAIRQYFLYARIPSLFLAAAHQHNARHAFPRAGAGRYMFISAEHADVRMVRRRDTIDRSIIIPKQR